LVPAPSNVRFAVRGGVDGELDARFIGPTPSPTRAASPIDDPHFFARRSMGSSLFSSSEPLPNGPAVVPLPMASLARRAGRAILLIVERDPHVRELEQYFLREAGYDVHFVDDGVAALDLARDLEPEIIVTEVIVPKLDGLALCRAIKSSDALSRTIVVVFSVLAVEQRAREAGADAFLLKPLGADRLIDTVRTLLAKRAATPPGGNQP
jgi:CheY-like chemotaxis protein